MMKHNDLLGLLAGIIMASCIVGVFACATTLKATDLEFNSKVEVLEER